MVHKLWSFRCGLWFIYFKTLSRKYLTVFLFHWPFWRQALSSVYSQNFLPSWIIWNCRPVKEFCFTRIRPSIFWWGSFIIFFSSSPGICCCEKLNFQKLRSSSFQVCSGLSSNRMERFYLASSQTPCSDLWWQFSSLVCMEFFRYSLTHWLKNVSSKGEKLNHNIICWPHSRSSYSGQFTEIFFTKVSLSYSQNKIISSFQIV